MTQNGEGRRKSGVWYYVVTIASVGLLASVPFFHSASVLRRRQLWRLGAGYAAAALVGIVLLNLAPVDKTGTAVGWMADVGGALVLVMMVAGVVQQRGLRRQVYGTGGQLPSRLDPAVQEVQRARARRAEARELAERDPGLARELRIGRPDLPRHYDDGGLVDLNTAPAAAIAGTCGIPITVAQSLISTRDQFGRFSSAEEAIVYGKVPDDAAQALRERGLILPEAGSR